MTSETGVAEVAVFGALQTNDSKLDQNFMCFGFKLSLAITTKFCTRHDSVTVVMCAKFRCDQLSIFL